METDTLTGTEKSENLYPHNGETNYTRSFHAGHRNGVRRNGKECKILKPFDSYVL